MLIIHRNAVDFHRRLSSLTASPIECISRCAPLAPDGRSDRGSPSDTHIHTVKCLRAIQKINELLSLPIQTAVHSPFLICMIANVTIAHLSACRYVFRGQELAQCREKIRLTLGTLKTLSQYWLLGRQTHEEIGIIAQDCLFSAQSETDHSSATDETPQHEFSTFGAMRSRTSNLQDEFGDFGLFTNDDLHLDNFEGWPRLTPGV